MHILLSADAGTPSAASIVEGFDFAAGGAPPLAGLAAETPIDAQYLLPVRATGAFAQYLANNPDTPRARLERYIVVRYSASSNVPNARDALLSDPDVEHAHVPASADFAVPPGNLHDKALSPDLPSTLQGDWRAPVNVVESWHVAGGWALVGVIDSGIATAHPALASFADGQYRGGNWLPALSYDLGRTGLIGCQTVGDCIEDNVDEAQPVAVPAGGICDPDGDGLAAPVIAGHGTHVAGLIAARGPANFGVCKHCGIAAWRAASDTCSQQSGLIRTALNVTAIDAAVALLSDLGAQVINLSSTRSTITKPGHCQSNVENSECQALLHAARRGVLVTGAAGNHRSSIGFPASNPSVLSAGGVGNNLAIWNRDPDSPPNHLDQCPQQPTVFMLGQECGSNFTVNLGNDRRQEVSAPAESVQSTTYPGLNWNPALGCGDGIDGPNGDGTGSCTGTSMAAPIAAGIAGVLRSINPLVLPGDPENLVDAMGIRDVIASTTGAAKSGEPWNQKLGYGIPDTAAAARRMLGEVRGARVRNRAIPLFDFHSALATDYASTTSPQAAMTLSTGMPWSWLPRGPAIPGYPSYPVAPDNVMPSPHASAYVMSTEFRPNNRQPPLVPLFQLSRSRPWPLGCTPGTAGCQHQNRDFVLVSSEAHLESAVADGYQFHGRQGYIFQRCAKEPSCMPAGSTKLYRLCNTQEDDCAVFLEHELATFQGEGYTTPYPSGSDQVIGYAFRNVDADGDTLVDGFEHLIGTNPVSADSDGDSVSDGVEYPLAGVPMSDPCAGPAVSCPVAEMLYDGFE